jgi:two-component system chemotaxis response regulator CheB
MIRVLIAEDSATCLGLLVEIIGSDPELKVIATASHGAEAVTMTRDLRPDVVVMDIHMPIMDGFEATRHIMTDVPTPIVIVSATVNVREVAVSMHALRLGALALMPKPSLSGTGDFRDTARQFTASIRAMSQVRVVRRWNPRSSLPPARLLSPLPATAASARILAIAASTGGPGALYRILSELPASFPVPIVIVQHIATGFVEGLANWLNGASKLRVKVAVDGERIEPGTAYIAPDDLHLGLSHLRQLAVSTAPPIGGFRPSATHLFETVARLHGARSLALVLTGMGDDGLPGLRAVHAAGGRVLAQDEETSVVFGMPGVAVAAGVTDSILPLELIAARLVRLVGDARTTEGSHS